MTLRNRPGSPAAYGALALQEEPNFEVGRMVLAQDLPNLFESVPG